MLKLRPSLLSAWLRLATACVLVLFATGCISNKAFWQRTMNKKPGNLTMHFVCQKDGAKPSLVLAQDFLNKNIAGTETNGKIRVSYGPELRSQAELVGNALERALQHTERRSGLAVRLQPHIYLLRLTNETRVIECTLEVPEKEKTMPLLMLITNAPPAALGSPAASPATLWADLKDFPVQLFITMHEACEVRLIDPVDLLVMPDVHASQWFIHYNWRYHTRWFREGFSHYSAYHASQDFRRQLIEDRIDPGLLTFPETSMRPFSKLAKVKHKLFNWNQTSTPELDRDNYEAAFGLFLLLEHCKGPEAVAELARELPVVKFPDGKSLLKMIQQKTGLDLRQLARAFQFPDLGMELRADAQNRLEVQSIAPDSWATRAHLQKGDVLLAANAAPIQGVTGLELQILKAHEQGQPLQLTFLRNGERHTTEALNTSVLTHVN